MKVKLSELLSEIFRDGQLFFVSGRKGSGKTLLASTIGLVMQNKFDRVLANFNLYLVKNFEPLTKYSQIKEAKNSLIIIDESYEFFSSRTATSKRNQLFNDIVAKARKNKNVYILISHSPRFVDKTLRIMANGVFFPALSFKTEKKEDEGIVQIPDIMTVVFVNSVEGADIFLLEESLTFSFKITKDMLINYNTYEQHFEIEFDLPNKKSQKKR